MGRHHCARTLLFILLIPILLSCRMLAPAAPNPPALREIVPRVEPSESAPDEPIHEETETDLAGKIQVDYVYTSELITPIYQLYGSYLDDFVVVTIENGNSEVVRVIVESEILGYTSQSIDTVEVGPQETVEVRQNPLLSPDAIDRLNAQMPAEFHLRVVVLEQGVERQILEETGETLIFARRDFPWSISGFEQSEVYELLAAMVTPHDPAVEELIREAANYHPDGIMTSGYGGIVDDDEGKVWDRLEAIWDAEANVYQLTYISTWVSFAPGDVQRIRLPAEVLEQNSGNCIELALLFASAAEAIDLEPALILVPGHAYIAIRTDQENANYYFIETTLIGRADFSEAVESGANEYEDAQPHLEAHETSYGWVTIYLAREKGILPIAWR